MTDIIFMRKRSLDEPLQSTRTPNGFASRPLVIEDMQIPINRFFLNNPEMVLGALTRKDTLYGGEGYTASPARATWQTNFGRRFRRCRNSFPLTPSPSPEKAIANFATPPAGRDLPDQRAASFWPQCRTICQRDR